MADTRTREQKQADRKYAGARQEEFKKLLSQGADKEALAEAGFRPEKGGGQYHFSNLDLASEFGDIGMYSGFKIDIENKRIGEANADGSIRWRDMTPEEYGGIQDFQNWKYRQQDSMPGGGFADAYDSGYGSSSAFQGYLRQQNLDKTTKGGHLTVEPNSGWYYNVGLNNPNDPNSWEWFDQYGRPQSGAPTGYTKPGMGQAPKTPMGSPYDTALWQDTPFPMPQTSAFSLGLTGGSMPSSQPSGQQQQAPAPKQEQPKSQMPGTEGAVPDTSTQSTPLPSWSSLTGEQQKPKNFASLTGPNA